MKDPFDIKGKIVIITGGMGQLGRQYTLALLERGAKVAIFDTQVNPTSIHQRFPNKLSSDILSFYEVDITKKNSIKVAVQQISQKWGVPHVLVNNAALDSPPNASADENGAFEDYPEDSFDRVMEVNAKGVFLACQVIGAQMAVEGRGSIINIGSIYGLVSPRQTIYDYRAKSGAPFFKPIAYSVSKSALLNMTRYLATYWGGQGVRVNTLTLAGVFNQQDKEFLTNYCAHVPMGRMANEVEYNGAIIFLASDASSYMTGANLVMDGGWTAW